MMDVDALRGGWRDRIPILTPTKTPKAVLANALYALREAPEWQGVLGYDEFGLTTMAMLPPPWRGRQQVDAAAMERQRRRPNDGVAAPPGHLCFAASGGERRAGRGT